MGVPVILALTKNDKLRIIHGDKENEQRARLTRKVRQQLGFDGVHVHYSCDSTLPASRRRSRAAPSRESAMGARHQSTPRRSAVDAS